MNASKNIHFNLPGYSISNLQVWILKRTHPSQRQCQIEEQNYFQIQLNSRSIIQDMASYRIKQKKQ